MQSWFSSLLAVVLTVVTAAAQSLSGHIVDTTGAPVANVAVILSNGAPLGTTDAAGNFLISGLRNRTYTVQIDPHSNLLAAQQFDFNVVGAASLGTVTLEPAQPITATFVGPTGLGLLGVNMNAYLADGTKLFTPHDGSDALGNVTIAVPTNIELRIRAIPPVGSGLVPWQTFLTVTAPVALGTIQMPTGYAVTGSVVGPLGIGGCEFVTTDMLTGQDVLQLNKLSAPVTGGFSLLLPIGVYQIDIIPPVGNLHAARQILGLIVLGPRNLGLVTLQNGALLTGTVNGPSGAVANADIDVYTAGNDKLFTPNDNTTAFGTFSLVVPLGTSYSVRVDPLSGSGLVGARTAVFSFPTSTNLGVINLAAGVPLDLTVLDAANNPVAGANLNLHDPVTGAEIITPGDITDAAGHLIATIPVGTFDVSVHAPQGTLSAPLLAPGTVFSGATTTTVNLPAKTLVCNAEGLGILTIAPGGDLPLRFTFFNPNAFTVGATVEGFVQTPDGAITPWVPPLYLDFFGPFGMSIDFLLPTPVMTPADYGRQLKFVVRMRDAGTSAILDEAYIQFVIQP